MWNIQEEGLTPETGEDDRRMLKSLSQSAYVPTFRKNDYQES